MTKRGQSKYWDFLGWRLFLWSLDHMLASAIPLGLGIFPSVLKESLPKSFQGYTVAHFLPLAVVILSIITISDLINLLVKRKWKFMLIMMLLVAVIGFFGVNTYESAEIALRLPPPAISSYLIFNICLGSPLIIISISIQCLMAKFDQESGGSIENVHPASQKKAKILPRRKQ